MTTRFTHQARFAWLAVGLLAVLASLLAYLQYRWTGEISIAERARLEDGLEASLHRLSNDFNSEIRNAALALAPDEEQVAEEGPEQAYASRYGQWRNGASHKQLFRRIARAVPEPGGMALYSLDLETGRFARAEWPEPWKPLRDWMADRIAGEGSVFPRQVAVPLLEMPRFGARDREGGPPRELDWLLAEIDTDYVAGTMMPQLLARHLGRTAQADYHGVLTWRGEQSGVVFRTPGTTAGDTAKADASVTLFDPVVFPGFRRRGGGPRGFGRPPGLPAGPPPGAFPDSGRGRWLLSVRHRAGSLDAIVARVRLRNLAVSGGILLLMLGAIAALVHFSRQAQTLAELQMQFVAGVSHELRTPLTVIRTAAYNLRGKMSQNPAQVEKYGSLIQQESEKLAAIVEQVLRFAGAKAGRLTREREPISVEFLIDDTLAACKGVLESSHCEVEKRVDPGLPVILGDTMALQHALQNLIHNAIKYGTEASNWIGISAGAAAEAERQFVEIRVADRGPGIPQDEQRSVFDPFFRGRRAVQDQVHGTGLGLNLVKQIVEAHEGSVTLRSEPMKGSEFIIRLPVAPSEHQDEFAHTASRG